MSGKSDSVVTQLVDRVFPRMPDFYGLMNEQCDLVVDLAKTLVAFVEGGDEKTEGKLQGIVRRGDELKEHHVDILKPASPTAIYGYDVRRAIVTLDIAIDYAKITTYHIMGLGLTPDQFMFEMAMEYENCARALRQGFCKLGTNPSQAEEEIQAARRARRNMENIYRRALAELADSDEKVKMRKVDNVSLTALSDILDMLRRREIYHKLSKSVKRLVWAANRLQEILAGISHQGIE